MPLKLTGAECPSREHRRAVSRGVWAALAPGLRCASRGTRAGAQQWGSKKWSAVESVQLREGPRPRRERAAAWLSQGSRITFASGSAAPRPWGPPGHGSKVAWAWKRKPGGRKSPPLPGCRPGVEASRLPGRLLSLWLLVEVREVEDLQPLPGPGIPSFHERTSLLQFRASCLRSRRREGLVPAWAVESSERKQSRESCHLSVSSTATCAWTHLL